MGVLLTRTLLFGVYMYIYRPLTFGNSQRDPFGGDCKLEGGSRVRGSSQVSMIPSSFAKESGYFEACKKATLPCSHFFEDSTTNDWPDEHIVVWHIIVWYDRIRNARTR